MTKVGKTAHMNTREPLPGLTGSDIQSANRVLYEGRGHVIELNAPCTATITMEWLPRHQVKISLTSIESEIDWPKLHKFRPFHIRLDDLNGSNNVIEAYHRKSSQEVATAWLSERTIVGDASSQVAQISGFFVNFVSTLGIPLSTTSDSNQWEWCGRQHWLVSGWEITIDARPDLSSTLKDLEDSGGFARTHAVRIRKADGTEFTEAAATAVMEALHLSLSFLIGRYFAPTYTGQGLAGESIWEEWSSPKVDQLTKGRQELWNIRTGQKLEDIATPLINRFLDHSRRSSMGFLTQSYLGANSTALLEQRVLLAFAAIEHLAWIRLVHEQKKDPKKVDKENADWRIRRVLTDASISIHPPKHLPALSRFAKALNGDAPKAVAEVRHSLTHPKNPGSIYAQKGLLRDTWLILSHWLGLLILEWVGYNGRVVDTSDLNRWSGDTIPTPWNP